MKIPKKYAHKVYSFERMDDSFNSEGYEVNLEDDYEYEGSHVHYVDTYRQALQVMRDAHKSMEV